MIKLYVDGKLHSITGLLEAVSISEYLTSEGWMLKDRRMEEGAFYLSSRVPVMLNIL